MLHDFLRGFRIQAERYKLSGKALCLNVMVLNPSCISNRTQPVTILVLFAVWDRLLLRQNLNTHCVFNETIAAYHGPVCHAL